MNLLFSGDNFFTIDPANNHSHIPLLSVPHEGVVHLWYTRGPVAHCYRGAIRDELQDRAQITHNPEARFARVQHIPPLRLWWDDIREREVQFLIINVRGKLFFSVYSPRTRNGASLSPTPTYERIVTQPNVTSPKPNGHPRLRHYPPRLRSRVLPRRLPRRLRRRWTRCRCRTSQ